MTAALAPAASASADAAARWREAKSVLAVRLDNLGDLLMTTPALAALRRSLPQARLTLLASPSGAALAPHLPMVDEVIAYEAPWVKHLAAACGPDGAAVGEAERRMVERLAAGGHDAAVVFTVCTQSALPAALMCRMAGIGLRLAHSRENPYGLLTDWVRDRDLPQRGVRHEVRRQLDLVANVGCTADDERLVLRHGASDAEGARRHLAAAGVGPGEPYLVVHPGATAPSRRYLDDRWGCAAQLVCEATGLRAVFVGGEGERAAVEEALAAMEGTTRARAVALVGKLSLGELAALIAHSAVTLCNNSAPAHIAAAVGAPVVVLYALTNPQHTPWATASRVLSREVPCRDCLQSVCPQPRRACLDDIDAEAVAEAALDLLQSRPTAAPRPAPFLESA